MTQTSRQMEVLQAQYGVTSEKALIKAIRDEQVEETGERCTLAVAEVLMDRMLEGVFQTLAARDERVEAERLEAVELVPVLGDGPSVTIDTLPAAKPMTKWMTKAMTMPAQPAKKEAPAMTAKTESRPPCLCGCGGTPRGPKSRFIPGHDARYHAAQRKAGHPVVTAPKREPKPRNTDGARPVRRSTTQIDEINALDAALAAVGGASTPEGQAIMEAAAAKAAAARRRTPAPVEVLPVVAQVQ